MPVRDGPFHDETLNATVPDPTPDCPDVIEIHGASLWADHVHPAAVLTVIVPEPPLAPTVCDTGAIAVLHPTPWVTVTVCPATVSTPVRDGPVVARASNMTWPLPVPCAPSTMESHSVWLRAVHAHCALLAVTDTLLRSPAGDIETLVGETVKAHAAASCVMASCCSPTTMEPRRCEGSMLALTLNATLPSPCPAACAASWIQPPDADTFHWHSRLVLTLTVPVPPAEANVDGCAAAVTGHLLVEGAVTVWVDDPQLSDESVASTTRKTAVNRRIFSPLPRAVSAQLARRR